MLVAHLTAGGRLGIADLDKEDGSFHQDVEVPHHGFERGQLRRLFRRNDLTDIQESTPYVMNKQIRKKIQEFPVFLLTAQKGQHRVETPCWDNMPRWGKQHYEELIVQSNAACFINS
jgi:hypothetical protein